MFRHVEDFEQAWAYERDATLKLLRALTPASLEQRVSPEGRTLGRLAWHVVTSVDEMAEHSGMPVKAIDPTTPPPSPEEMIREYERASEALPSLVRAHWTDAMLLEKVAMYGDEWRRGQVLTALISHQAHHRGQMTVLMRQAGLPVPGIYGPAREEWAAFGMPAMD